MTLSAIDANGHPDARVLILGNVDSRGWHFTIKACSPKGIHIGASSTVELTFYWPQLGRQIRIRGPALALPASECAQDFLERPIGLRIAAIASKQSEIMLDKSELEKRVVEAERGLDEIPGYIAPEWRVFAIDPVPAELRQGAEDRMHQRVRYEKQGRDHQCTKLVLYP